MLEIVHFENWLPCFLMWMFNPGNVSINLRKVDIAIGGPWLCVGWSWMIYLSMYLILSYLILSYLILSYPFLSYPILSICLSIYPSIHLSIYPSSHLSTYRPIYLSTYLPFYLSIYLSN
jgi:hypothetical protein